MKFCEHCKKLLTEEDWPFSYKGIANLCLSCKLVAAHIIATQDKEKAHVASPMYQVS